MADNTAWQDPVYCPSCEHEVASKNSEGVRVDERCRFCGQSKKWIYPEELKTVKKVSVTEVAFEPVFEDLDGSRW